MDKQVFREKSLERISSPEQMHDYMRVTSPKLWMLLAAVVVLIAGFVIASFTYTLENSVDVQVAVSHDEAGDPAAVISLPLSEKGSVDTGMTVRFGTWEGKIGSLYQDQDTLNARVTLKESQEDPADGTYDGQVIIEQVNPIQFLLN